ncbi:hypothetical protein [Micromonospora echinospora]|uniref:hypothetical protein n=1 Tax=Micromonospora echinospora TaxID=1877 RepID=UPI00366AC634
MPPQLGRRRPRRTADQPVPTPVRTDLPLTAAVTGSPFAAEIRRTIRRRLHRLEAHTGSLRAYGVEMLCLAATPARIGAGRPEPAAAMPPSPASSDGAPAEDWDRWIATIGHPDLHRCERITDDQWVLTFRRPDSLAPARSTTIHWSTAAGQVPGGVPHRLLASYLEFELHESFEHAHVAIERLWFPHRAWWRSGRVRLAPRIAAHLHWSGGTTTALEVLR